MFTEEQFLTCREKEAPLFFFFDKKEAPLERP
jgi:hypothetical protein